MRVAPTQRRGVSRRWLGRLGVVLALFAPSLLLELGARLILPPLPPNVLPGLPPEAMEDDRLLWRNRPGYADAEGSGPINSQGFRGAERPPEARRSALRILSLGESTTYGVGVDWRETYSSLLERRLRARGRDVEVLNAGVQAWSTYQSTRFLSLEIDRIDPDLVLFYHEINDFLPTTWRGLGIPGAGLNDVEMAELVRRRSWLGRIVRSSRLLGWARLVWARSRASAAESELLARERTALVDLLPYRSIPTTRPPTPKPWLANLSRLVRLPEPVREASLRELIELTRKRGVQLVLLHPSYPVSKRHLCLLTRIAHDEAIPLLDVEEALHADAVRSSRTWQDYFVPGDAFHLSALGHAVLARALDRFLVERNLLAQTRS